MSKMADRDLQKKEAIEKLQGQRIELLEAIEGLEPEANKVDIYELLEKIAIINDQIKTITETV